MTLAQREERLARVRAITRVEMSLATVALILAVVIPFATRTFGPTYFGGGMPPHPWWIDTLAFLGTVGVVYGYVWLLRIRFRGPEDDKRSSWRSGSR